jgi:hypothetical protein
MTVLLAAMLAGLSAAVTLAVRIGIATMHPMLPRAPASSGTMLLFAAAFATGVAALWRFDRTRRRARGAAIRLAHVERRLASLADAPRDSERGGRPIP